jgi:hypothetical protein
MDAAHGPILYSAIVKSPTKIGSVVRVTAGNFLEMYDFMIYGYYAAAIGRTFFRCLAPRS